MSTSVKQLKRDATNVAVDVDDNGQVAITPASGQFFRVDCTGAAAVIRLDAGTGAFAALNTVGNIQLLANGLISLAHAAGQMYQVLRASTIIYQHTGAGAVQISPISGQEFSAVCAGAGTWRLQDAGSGDVSPAVVQTTDATTTTLATIPLATSDTGMIVDSRIIALRNDGTEGAAFQLLAAFRNDGGVVTQIGATTTVPFADAGAATWTAAYDISGTNVRVRITGQAAKTVNWRTRYRNVITP